MQYVVVLSGGMDSATLLYDLHAQDARVRALSVNYGQRHVRELAAAAQPTTRLGVEHRIADLSALRPLLAGSSQTDDRVAVPEGHYAEASMRVTIVPNRNMILLAVAAAWAISMRSDAVAYAAHAGDHAVYPDCREEFVAALGEALRLADWHQVAILRPYVALTKADIVRRGTDLRVPYELTWSCYQGGRYHCGRCGTCVERREAFTLAGVPDPVPYEET